MENEIKILTAAANIKDKTAMSEFIKPLPDGDSMIEIFKNAEWSGRAQYYDLERKTLFIVGCSKEIMTCYFAECL